MKKLFITIAAITIATTYSQAADRRPIEEVNTDEFTTDTQVTPKGVSDDHLALIWWIPNEFWESILSRNSTTSESDKKAMLDALSGVSLLAVVQADISTFGALNFYSKGEIQESMKLFFTNENGEEVELSHAEKVSPDLEMVLGIFKPILGAAMGNLGNNMHFYVLNDETESSSRLLDPYAKGQINIHVERKSGTLMEARIDLPINALFVPRKCPNGKDAHVSWLYCPWTGERLKQ